jgi:ABC-type transporter Mla subunit MlaD
MVRDPGDVAVGIVALGAALAAVAVLFWLGGEARQERIELYTHFADITGVAEGGPVLLRGYEVGRVREVVPTVTPAGEHGFRVRLDIRRQFGESTEIALPEGTAAFLRPAPVLGLGVIELVLPAQPATRMLDAGETIPGFAERRLVDQAAQLGERFSAEAASTLAGTRGLLDSLTELAGAARRLLVATDTTLAALGPTLQHQLVLTARLTEDVQEGVRQLTPALAAGADSVSLLLGESRALVRDVTTMLHDDGAHVRTLLENLEASSSLLEYLMVEFARRPYRVFTGIRLPPPDTAPGAPYRRRPASP